MKIGIDLSRAVNEKAGIARYCQNLALSLSKLDQKNKYQLYFSFWRQNSLKERKIRQIKKEFGPRAQVFIFRLPGILKEWFWSWRRFSPYRKLFKETEIFHASSYLELPLFLNKPSIVTIYDLTTFLFPDQRGEKVSQKLSQKTRAAVQKADRIIAISQSTKEDLMKFCHVDEDKIKVIHLAVSDEFRPISRIKKKPVILTVGTVEPRKNLARLIEAYQGLSAQIKSQYQLWIVGASGWNISGIYELTKKDPNIKFLGHIPDKKLAKLYNEAEIFVYPSLYEGFGLPPLEAMACGTPVLTSNISSLPEVVDKAAVLINPESVDSIRDGLRRLIGDKKLQEKLRKSGLLQAKKFSWKKCAQQTLKIYQELYKLLPQPSSELNAHQRIVEKPKLAIVSDWIRRDLQQPMRYFRRMKICHLYQNAGYQDMVREDFENTWQYKGSLDLYLKLRSANPDLVQGPEPYASRRAFFNSLICFGYCLMHKKKLFFPMFENRPVEKKFGKFLGFFLRMWLRFYSARAKAIIAINLGAKQNLLSAGVNPDKIESLIWATWGVDTEEFKAQNSKLKAKEPTILFVGKVEEKKGILDLFTSFDRVRKMIPDIKLLVAGPAEKEMLKEIEEHRGVEYLGIIKNRDLPAYFQKSWITVTPSITTANWEEQVGMVNIQSMACGTPVISTYSGAIPEFVPDNLAGILVPEKKIDQLTGAIAKLILDDKLREKMGHSAAVYAALHYDAAANVRKAEKFVMELLRSDHH